MQTTQKISPQKKEKPFLNEVLFKYFPYWPLFIVFIIVSLFAAWFYLQTVVPQYEISASIMLKDEKKGSSDGEMLTSLDQLSGKKIVENEMEILQSKTLMTQVVENLYLYASFFEKHKFHSKPAYSTSPIQIVAEKPENIRKADKVEFQFSTKDSQVIIDQSKYPLNQFVNTNYGRLKFILNKNQTSDTPQPLFFSLIPLKNATAGLLASLRTSPSTKLTTVLSLKITDAAPERGENILNELISVYNKASIDDKTRLAATTFSFVKERLDSVEKQLHEIEKKAQAYKSSRGAVDIGTQGQLFLQNVSDNDQKLADVNLQLSVLNEVEKYVRAKDNANTSGTVPSTIGLQDPTLPGLLNNLYEKELTIEKLKKTTGKNNPLVTSLSAQVDRIKPSLLENIQSQRASLEASRSNLNATNNSYSSVIQSIPQKERELIDINRQQAIKSSLYSFLLQKKEESALSHASNISDTRIVDKAQASFDPVSPKPMLIYAIALVFALAVPTGFVFGKEFLNGKILFRQEIEGLTNAPIIGEISFDKTKNPLVIQEGKRTFIAEQFRRLRTSLGYIGGDSGKKKVLVTSSLSGEGKSFVAANLALSLALTGKKIVLIELDLANPSLSKKLDVNYEEGVSSYLRGDSEPEDIIKRTTINNNLFFIPSGPLPENPSELLLSPRLKKLLAYLEDVFDVLVIDSAPASLLSDAYILSPLCDVTLYVVKHKFTPKSYLERLDEESAANQLNNLRIVFNGIRSRGFTKNGYGYGYGYGYIHNDNVKVKKKVI